MLVKLVAGNRLENWLLPTAGGKHSIRAEEYAASLAAAANAEGSLTVCSVVIAERQTDSFIEGTKKILEKAVSRIEAGKQHKSRKQDHRKRFGCQRDFRRLERI